MSFLPKTLIVLSMLSSTAWAIEATTPATVAPAPATTIAINSGTTPATAPAKPLTAEQIAKAKAEQDNKIKALVKDQAGRLKQLEQANLDALTQNQALQLKNDNLLVQVQVLQSERSAQMFIYGAVTLGVGVLLGFIITSYIHTKRRRQW